MNDVETNLQCVITANSAWKSFCGVGRSHRRTYYTDSLGAFQDTNNDWTRCYMFHQAVVEGFPLVDAVMFLSQFRGDVYQFKADNRKATSFETRKNVSDEPSLYAFWFYDN